MGKRVPSGILDTFSMFILELTPRQTEVCLLLARGLSIFKISAKLDISPSTVELHQKAIYKRLDIHTGVRRIKLVLMALKRGWIRVEDLHMKKSLRS